MREDITPPGGVETFLSYFGGPKHARIALLGQGLDVASSTISRWVRANYIPDYCYAALKSLINEEETRIAENSIIEVYLQSKPIGKLFLAKGISLVVKKAHPNRNQKQKKE